MSVNTLLQCPPDLSVRLGRKVDLPHPVWVPAARGQETGQGAPWCALWLPEVIAVCILYRWTDRDKEILKGEWMKISPQEETFNTLLNN